MVKNISIDKISESQFVSMGEEWNKRILPRDSKNDDEYLEAVRSIETPAKNMRHDMVC
jgi:hypothetical protein